MNKAVCVYPFKKPQYPRFYQPSKDGNLAMDLIKEYKINLNHIDRGEQSVWRASMRKYIAGESVQDIADATNPIIAALRCLVFNQVGTMVCVPEEFAGGIKND